ncbi:hypothetical protein K435DRAFT_812787 [Dendrothele bispora CBS 962.96]|uniref:Uncharacterized protein n=1 Tax=Dendrothele bispora (strain CBS 962.96) TaxID=1314807 RepID=A0A4S8KN82_DENBC|nr:hypothetical protein K435DRAFT_812787 [Dendrothele bispora CBS 962.96]
MPLSNTLMRLNGSQTVFLKKRDIYVYTRVASAVEAEATDFSHIHYRRLNGPMATQASHLTIGDLGIPETARPPRSNLFVRVQIKKPVVSMGLADSGVNNIPKLDTYRSFKSGTTFPIQAISRDFRILVQLVWRKPLTAVKVLDPKLPIEPRPFRVPHSIKKLKTQKKKGNPFELSIDAIRYHMHIKPINDYVKKLEFEFMEADLYNRSKEKEEEVLYVY